jgi:hypothetical protein
MLFGLNARFLYCLGKPVFIWSGLGDILGLDGEVVYNWDER